MLSSSFRHYQIYNCQRYDFGHTWLCYLSRTWVFNEPKFGSLNSTNIGLNFSFVTLPKLLSQDKELWL